MFSSSLWSKKYALVFIILFFVYVLLDALGVEDESKEMFAGICLIATLSYMLIEHLRD